MRSPVPTTNYRFQLLKGSTKLGIRLSTGAPPRPCLLLAPISLFRSSCANHRPIVEPSSSYDYKTVQYFSTRASNNGFKYCLAASFSPKGQAYNPKDDHFSYGFSPQSDSRPWKRPNSGQDSYFVSSIGPPQSQDVAFGVADGVGGYSDSGIDSAHFSHGLCEQMRDLAGSSEFGDGSKLIRPRDLLERSYEKILRDRSIEGGGTTACVAAAYETGNIEVANLGDSGFVHLRLNAVHYQSRPQTHAFNTPYQLGIVPPKILARTKLFGGRALHDLPSDANITSHTARHGDVLIFATDGLWDNLSAMEILRVVSQYMMSSRAWIRGNDDGQESGKGVVTAKTERLEDMTTVGKTAEFDLQSTLAVAVTKYAKMASMDSKRSGPFAREARRWFPDEDTRGGKVDDICVVVAVVVET